MIKFQMKGYDFMAFMNFRYYSKALGMQADFNVVMPQSQTIGEIGNEKSGGKAINLLLLHGLSDDNSIWMRRTSIERYADFYGINVIMPMGAKSFYTDMKYGGAYYEHIAKEIPGIASAFLRLPEGKENWYAAGLSMGGYGALKIALKENDFFAGGAALSPVTLLQNPAFADTLIPIFGEELNIPASEDLFKLTAECSKREENPRLLIINGKQDFMYEDYEKFLAHMAPLGFDFTHREYEGAHTWKFWDEYIKEVIEWIKGE